MKELEKLLNPIIEMGWKPFWIECITHSVYDCGRLVFRQSKRHSFSYSLRELVSLESGLWQFVCINDLYRYTWDELVLNPSCGPDWPSADWSFFCGDSAYRLIESALIPEEELGKFLVENIKL